MYGYVCGQGRACGGQDIHSEAVGCDKITEVRQLVLRDNRTHLV
jgi:hypothetical protein